MRLNKTLLTILLLFIATNVYGAVGFDGVDDVIPCTTIAYYTLKSVSCWIKPTSLSTDIFIGKYTSGSGGWVLEVNAGEYFRYWESRDGGDGYAHWSTDAGTITTGNWYHIGMTYDNTNNANNPILYINGVSVNVTETNAVNDNPQDESVAEFAIGDRWPKENSEFDGEITEVHYYNVILTPTEMALLGKSRLKGISDNIRPSNRRGYWPLDDEEAGTSGDGDTFLDLSGNGNNGTGDNGANNTGLTATGETVLSYPSEILTGN